MGADVRQVFRFDTALAKRSAVELKEAIKEAMAAMKAGATEAQRASDGVAVAQRKVAASIAAIDKQRSAAYAAGLKQQERDEAVAVRSRIAEERKAGVAIAALDRQRSAAFTAALRQQVRDEAAAARERVGIERQTAASIAAIDRQRSAAFVRMARDQSAAIAENSRRDAVQFSEATAAAAPLLAGLAVAAGAGAAAVIALGVAYAKAAEAAIPFQRGIAEVSTLLGDKSIPEAFGVSVAGLREEIVGMSGGLGTATELTKGLYEALSAGIVPAQGLAFVADAAKLAKAGLADTASTVKLLASTLNAYGLQADSTARISDVLFKTVEKGITTIPELVGSLGTVIPLAAKLNVPIEEVGAALATLTVQGVKTDEAVTQLKQTFNAFITNADKFRAAGIDILAVVSQGGLPAGLAALERATGGNIEKMKEFVPEIRALLGVLGLAGPGAKIFAENLTTMTTAAGATDVAFGKMRDTGAFALDELKGKVTGAALIFGSMVIDNIIGPTNEAAEKIGAFVQSAEFRDWAERAAAAVNVFVAAVRVALDYLQQLIGFAQSTVQRFPGIVSAITGGIQAAISVLPGGGALLNVYEAALAKVAKKMQEVGAVAPLVAAQQVRFAQSVGVAGVAAGSNAQRLGVLRAELARLDAAGQKGSPQYKAVATAIAEIGQAGGKTKEEMRKLAAEQNKESIEAEKLARRFAELNDTTIQQVGASRERTAAFESSMHAYAKMLDEAEQQQVEIARDASRERTAIFEDEMRRRAELLDRASADAAGAFGDFAVSGGGVGARLGGLGTGLLANLTGSLQHGLGIGDSLTQMLAGLKQAGETPALQQIFGAVLSTRGGLGDKAGAGIGAGVGAGITKGLTAATKGITGTLGKVLGGAIPIVGGLVSSLIGPMFAKLFGGTPAYKKNVQDVVHRNLGVSLSQGVAEAVRDIKLEVGTAGLTNEIRNTLGLDKILTEATITGANAGKFAGEFSKLAVIAGGVGKQADYARAHVGPAYALLRQKMVEAGLAGSVALHDLNVQGQALAKTVPEIAAAFRGELTGAAGDLDRILGAGAKGFSAAGTANLGAFAADLLAGLRTIPGASRDALGALGEGLDAIVAAAKKAGTAVPEGIAGLLGERQFYKANEGLLGAIAATASFAQRLGEIGFVTQPGFAALESQVGIFTGQLATAGKTGQDSLGFIAPILQQIVNAAGREGYTIDAATQSLIDQAAAFSLVKVAGTDAFSAMKESNDYLLGGIAAILGKTGQLNAYLGQTAAAARDVSRAAGGIGGAIPDIKGRGKPQETHAGGGLVGPFGGYAGAGEWVVPRERVRQVGTPALASLGSGSPIVMNVSLNITTAPGTTAEQARDIGERAVQAVRRAIDNGQIPLRANRISGRAR